MQTSSIKDIISCLKQGKYHPNICLVTSLKDITKAHIALDERKFPWKNIGKNIRRIRFIININILLKV